MSADYSAKLVYGVELTEKEYYEVRRIMDERDGYEDMITPYLQQSNPCYPDEGINIIGIVMDSVDAGDSAEVSVNALKSHCIDPVLDILNVFYIEREPTWHLLCEVSLT